MNDNQLKTIFENLKATSALVALLKINGKMSVPEKTLLELLNKQEWPNDFITNNGSAMCVTYDKDTKEFGFELMYEDVVVADALFVGNNLTDGGRAAAIVDVEAVTSLNSFTYVGANGNGAAYGKTAAWNLVSIGDAVTFTEAADIATTGNVRGVTSNFGNQFGVGDLVYTSGIDTVGVTGLDSAAGNVSLNYTKALGGSSIVTIKITGISGSIWSVYQTSMV